MPCGDKYDHKSYNTENENLLESLLFSACNVLEESKFDFTKNPQLCKWWNENRQWIIDCQTRKESEIARKNVNLLTLKAINEKNPKELNFREATFLMDMKIVPNDIGHMYILDKMNNRRKLLNIKRGIEKIFLDSWGKPLTNSTINEIKRKVEICILYSDLYEPKVDISIVNQNDLISDIYYKYAIDGEFVYLTAELTKVSVEEFPSINGGIEGNRERFKDALIDPKSMADGYWGGFGKEGIWFIDENFPNLVFIRRKNLETGYWEVFGAFENGEWRDLKENENSILGQQKFVTKEEEQINISEYYSRQYIINSFDEIQPKIRLIYGYRHMTENDRPIKWPEEQFEEYKSYEPMLIRGSYKDYLDMYEKSLLKYEENTKNAVRRLIHFGLDVKDKGNVEVILKHEKEDQQFIDWIPRDYQLIKFLKNYYSL